MNPKVVYPSGYSGATIDTIEVEITDTGLKTAVEFATMLPTGTLVALRGQASSEFLMEDDITEDDMFYLIFGCDTPTSL